MSFALIAFKRGKASTVGGNSYRAGHHSRQNMRRLLPRGILSAFQFRHEVFNYKPNGLYVIARVRNSQFVRAKLDGALCFASLRPFFFQVVNPARHLSHLLSVVIFAVHNMTTEGFDECSKRICVTA